MVRIPHDNVLTRVLELHHMHGTRSLPALPQGSVKNIMCSDILITRCVVRRPTVTGIS